MTMRRIVSFLFIAAAALGSQDLLAQCGTCEPGLKTGYDVNAQHTVYLDPSLSSAAMTAAQEGMDKWNAVFTGNGEREVFVYTSNPNMAEIVVSEDPSLHGKTDAGVFSPGTIQLNPDYDGAKDFLRQVLLHEFGHAIGFTDVYTSGCDRGQTIMYGIIDPNASSFNTGVGGSDTCRLGREWARIDRERLTPVCGFSCQEGAGADSPIVINLGRGSYRLSGAEDPVLFDIAASGHPAWIGWTAAAEEEAFLCLDRNGDGAITSGAELFGNATPLRNGQRAPNGFVALAEYDDNHDGVIDAHDAIWSSLLLWTDVNHDGVSQPWEIVRISESAVTGISLTYHWSGKHDSSGNTFRYESKVWMLNSQGQQTAQPVYDIFFVAIQ